MFRKMTSSMVVLLLSSSFAVAFGTFSYNNQPNWPGICVTGNQMQQSPINIVTADVQVSDALIDLELSGWDAEYDGTFINTGHNVQFTPDTPFVATLRNHLGLYQQVQFHIHWGRESGEGSEHRINGEQAELEIHFVTIRQDAANTRNFISVISVLGDVDEDKPISGPWLQLEAAAIETFATNTTVEGFRYDSLLPENLDYYHYAGGRTSPDCEEDVNWFVLQNRVTVPGAYLAQLRQTEIDSSGDLLTFTFRDEQPLAGRVVTTPSSGTAMGPQTTISFLMIALIVIKLF